MAIKANPVIVRDGLVLALDAANLRSFDSYENLLLYSEDFSNAYWTKTNVSVASTTTILSPTGSTNVSKLVGSASTSVHELIRGSDVALAVGSDTYITLSIFAKAAERQYCYIRSAGNSKRIAVVVDLSNGTFNVTNWSFTLNSSATVTPYPNGWYRITATSQSNYPAAPGWAGQFVVSPIDSYQTAGNVGGSGYSYTGDGTSGIYIWGANYEYGPGISNYYPTTGTAKTRGTTLTDLSGLSNTGTLTNGPTYSSSNGGSIVFDGTDDYIQTIRNDITDNSSFSLSCWFRITTLNSTYRPLIDGGNLGSGTLGYTLAINNFNRLYVAANAGFVEISNSITTNTWYNVVGTASSGSPYSFNVYLNGVLGTVNTSATTNTLTNNASFVRLGQNINGSAIRFPGNIASVKIYNRALTASEIQQNYYATKSRYGL